MSFLVNSGYVDVSFSFLFFFLDHCTFCIWEFATLTLTPGFSRGLRFLLTLNTLITISPSLDAQQTLYTILKKSWFHQVCIFPYIYCKPAYTGSRNVFKTLPNIESGAFLENSQRLLIINYFRKTLHLYSPKNFIFFFRLKMKDDLSEKKTWKHDIFLKCSEKMIFPKKSD